MRIRKRESWHSTEALEFSVQHFEYTFAIPKRPIQCRGFMTASIDVDNTIPCSMLFFCLAFNNSSQVKEQHYYPLQEQAFNTDLREENYYRFQEKQFNTELWSLYPSISAADACKVTESFMEIIQIANATHRCPECHPGSGFATSHEVRIKIQPRSRSHHTPYDVIMEEEEEEEEEVQPRERPATTASILELLKDSKRIDGGGEGQCSICMEDIETRPRNRLRMPCSHWFHRTCLLHWLNKSHFCPLCRYEMPAAQWQSDVDSCS